MLDNTVCAGTGVLAGSVLLQNEAMSLRQEIGELIMFESGMIEMNLIAMPVSADEALLEFDLPVVAGTQSLIAKIKGPSRDVSIVIGQVTVLDDQTGHVRFKALPTFPVLSLSFDLRCTNRR